MTAVRLAVVGSREFADPLTIAIARAVIDRVIVGLAPEVVISGGAAGVDTWARTAAGLRGYRLQDGTFIEHLPASNRWHPDGYKQRNERIIADCTHLLAVRSCQSRTYGSGWAADRAERQGRTVWRVVLP